MFAALTVCRHHLPTVLPLPAKLPPADDLKDYADELCTRREDVLRVTYKPLVCSTFDLSRLPPHDSCVLMCDLTPDLLAARLFHEACQETSMG